MLRDKYEIAKFFVDIQGLTSEMEPELARIDKVLDDEAIYQLVKSDLSQRYPKTRQTGRPSTPVEVILRMLVVKHLYRLSYEKTEKAVKDSLVLRRFCRVYFEDVPDDTTLMRWSNQIQAETLKALHERVVQIARELKVTKGRKLRTDGTVVETNIHYPTDSSLLDDGVRVLSRYLKQAQKIVGQAKELGKAVFRDRSRSARYVKREIEGVASKGQDKTRPLYQKIVKITQASADRGVYSEPNETYATQRGVKRVILPKAGYKSQKRREHERQAWFRRGRHYHAGVEGRISVLKRKYGLDRCLNRSENGFDRWVGWGVIANNLTSIGRKCASRI